MSIFLRINPNPICSLFVAQGNTEYFLRILAWLCVLIAHPVLSALLQWPSCVTNVMPASTRPSRITRARLKETNVKLAEVVRTQSQDGTLVRLVKMESPRPYLLLVQRRRRSLNVLTVYGKPFWKMERYVTKSNT